MPVVQSPMLVVQPSMATIQLPTAVLQPPMTVFQPPTTVIQPSMATTQPPMAAGQPPMTAAPSPEGNPLQWRPWKQMMALFDLKTSNQDLKSDLKDLYKNLAVQMDVAGNCKAIVVHVPYRLRKAFNKIIATRRILRPPKKGSAAQRPRSRTLTAVHDAMLEDIVYPSEIIGKRVRYCIDGSKIIKIFLDSNATKYKSETFSRVYRKFAGKDVVFEYHITEPIHSTKKPFQRRNREKKNRNEKAGIGINIGNSSGCGGDDGDDGICVLIVE
ncbi:40S ribosomal protein S7-like [Telopea speciosissima]|uniref:40S ribosomal protein S7-like n=1 Tax=Telopea speciosissima TaxID=54955 RepID=UPI001CC5D8DA|nr:40S ribosomal protein S7-like [Telopea speciosissima]